MSLTWKTQRALESYSMLMSLLGEMTEEEVLAALRLEEATQRRRSMIDRLIARAVRLREEAYRAQLLREFHHHGNQEDRSEEDPRPEG